MLVLTKKAKILLLILLFCVLAFAGALIERFEGDAFIMETTTSEDDLAYISEAEEVVDGKININSASAVELDKLEGIGAALVERIIEFREENGPFVTIEEITKVSGISDKKFENIKDFICAE